MPPTRHRNQKIYIQGVSVYFISNQVEETALYLNKESAVDRRKKIPKESSIIFVRFISILILTVVLFFR